MEIRIMMKPPNYLLSPRGEEKGEGANL